MRRDEMMEGTFKVEEVEQKRRWKSKAGVFFFFLFFFYSSGEESLPEVPSRYCDGQFRKPKSQGVE